MSAKIVTERRLKNGKTISVLVKSKQYADIMEKGGVVFRHLKPTSKSRKSRSESFLQEITLEDGSRVRIYAKNSAQAKQIAASMGLSEPKPNKGFKVEMVESETPEVLSEKLDDVITVEIGALKFTAENTRLIATGTNQEERARAQEYLAHLINNKKLLPYDEAVGHTATTGHFVIEIPVQNSDQKVKYQVSGEEKEKVESLLGTGIILAPTEQLNMAEPENLDDSVKGPKDPTGPKPGPTNPPLNAHAIPPEPEKKHEASAVDSLLPVEETKSPSPAPVETKKTSVAETPKPVGPNPPKKHIFRKIMQGVLVGLMAAVGILAAPFTGGLSMAPAIVGAVFAGIGFKKSNTKLEAREQQQYREGLVSAVAEKGPEMLEGRGLTAEEQLEIIDSATTVALKKKDAEARLAGAKKKIDSVVHVEEDGETL